MMIKVKQNMVISIKWIILKFHIKLIKIHVIKNEITPPTNPGTYFSSKLIVLYEKLYEYYMHS